jgi:hypothetical protein
MPMPTWEQIRDLTNGPYTGAFTHTVATLRLAIAAERIADALEGMQAAGATGDAPVDPC